MPRENRFAVRVLGLDQRGLLEAARHQIAHLGAGHVVTGNHTLGRTVVDDVVGDHRPEETDRGFSRSCLTDQARRRLAEFLEASHSRNPIAVSRDKMVPIPGPSRNAAGVHAGLPVQTHRCRPSVGSVQRWSHSGQITLRSDAFLQMNLFARGSVQRQEGRLLPRPNTGDEMHLALDQHGTTAYGTDRAKSTFDESLPA